MDNPQFYLGQKVIYTKMPREPLTLLVITDIKGNNITAQFDGGTSVTSDKSSFKKFVPKKETDTSKDTTSTKKYTNKKYNKTYRSFKKK